MSGPTDAPAVNDQVAAEPTVTDSAPVETKDSEVVEPLADGWDEPVKAKDDPKAETDSKESEADTVQPADEKPAEETKADEQPLGKADERKQQLNTEIRDLVAQRNALKAEVEKTTAQAYQPDSVEGLVEQGYTELEAKVEAMRQGQEVERFNAQVVDAQLTLESESSRVLNDFPIFDPQSDQYRPEVAAKAANLLSKNLVLDPNTGQVIGSNVSPYQLYETIADASQISAQDGQVRAQQATEKMLANADAPTSASPPKVKEDPILAILKSDDY